MKKVDELSESRRGSGSSGKKIHLQVLRGYVESSSGSEGSWSFINESEDVSAAVWSSEEGRRGNEEHLVIPMAADEPGRSSNAVSDAAEQSNDDGAAVRGGSHERRGVDLEGGSDGAPAAAFEVAEIVSGIHRNQLRRALVEGDTNTAPVLLHGFQEAEEAEVISESSGTLPLEGSTTGEAGDGREPGEDGAHETSELPVMGNEAERRNPEASRREGHHADERDGREGHEEVLARVPSEVAYVEESLQETDGEAVDAAAADVAEINYEVRRTFRGVSANNDFVFS